VCVCVRVCDGVASQKLVQQLVRFEPQIVYASPDASVADDADKTMVTLSKLTDRELVATVAWAKQVPGIVSTLRKGTSCMQIVSDCL